NCLFQIYHIRSILSAETGKFAATAGFASFCTAGAFRAGFTTSAAWAHGRGSPRRAASSRLAGRNGTGHNLHTDRCRLPIPSSTDTSVHRIGVTLSPKAVRTAAIFVLTGVLLLPGCGRDEPPAEGPV